MSEEEVLEALDQHDAIVAACARGELPWDHFERTYASFYPHYALDGHETDGEGKAVLDRHVDRIELHRKIWDEVLTKLTLDEHVGVYPGFIGAEEAQRRLRDLAREYRLL
ncbi:MAG: hypothetical protein ACKV2T_00415 [Kofleriaceae bacterium]